MIQPKKYSHRNGYAIEDASSIPVIGSVRKLSLKHFPQRHLGLLPWHEHPQAMGFIEDAAKVAEDCVDIEAVLEIARQGCDALSADTTERSPLPDVIDSGARPRIGVLKDAAFQFYYPENLEALERLGAEVVTISALSSESLPDLDALYIGGGFPETHAESLANNATFRDSVKRASRNGLPIYGECGGLMFLSENLIIDDKRYPMTGVFPINSVLDKRPQGHGYIQARADRPNPFFPVGLEPVGHEFHYSYIADLDESGVSTAFQVMRGHGIDGRRDGVFTENALATYVHLHALGTPVWAESLVRKAREYAVARREQSSSDMKGRDRVGAMP
jgi:cobyrinic acid a,c-diamide synthase